MVTAEEWLQLQNVYSCRMVIAAECVQPKTLFLIFAVMLWP